MEIKKLDYKGICEIYGNARACGWHQSDAINALCCGLCKIMSWIEKALYGLSDGLVGRFCMERTNLIPAILPRYDKRPALTVAATGYQIEKSPLFATK